MWIWLSEDKSKVKIAHFRLPSASQKRACNSLKFKALANEDTLLRKHCCSWYFLGAQTCGTQNDCCVSMLRKMGNIYCRHKMFLNKIRNFFVSATNVARAGKRGNICVGNNVSATMFPQGLNNRATTTHHNYSRWQRPGNLKTKRSVFESYLFQTQTPSFEKLVFCGLKLFPCFSGGFLQYNHLTITATLARTKKQEFKWNLRKFPC